MGVTLHVSLLPFAVDAVRPHVFQLMELDEEDAFSIYCEQSEKGYCSIVYANPLHKADETTKRLSEILSTPAMYISTYDGDYWMYELYSQGTKVDKFCQAPLYWKRWELWKLWTLRGRARRLAAMWPDVTVKEIRNYLRFNWEFRDEHMAYAQDEFPYGDCWQFIDFLGALGGSYPEDSEAFRAFEKGPEKSENEAVPEYDRRDERGITPLITAVARSDVAAVRQLLTAGADPNKSSYHGSCPLHGAMYQPTYHSDERLEMIRLLFQYGADPEVRNSSGQGPIHFAAMYGNGELIQLLLTQGCDVDLNDLGGSTPLMDAARKGNVALMKQLVDSGANGKLVGIHGNSVLASAKRSKSKEAIALAKQLFLK